MWVTHPAYLLVDSSTGGTPSDLIESHAKALALVAERDHYPILIAAQELPQIAIDGERDAIAWEGANRKMTSDGAGSGPL